MCVWQKSAVAGVMNEIFNAVKLQPINNATKHVFDDGWPIQDPQQWTQTQLLWIREAN